MAPSRFSSHLPMPQALEDANGIVVGLEGEATREPKNPSPARDKVGLLVLEKFVCVEANLNQGISPLFICGQTYEVPESVTPSQACLAAAMLRLLRGERARRGSVRARPSIKTLLALGHFSPSQDIVFPGWFHKYAKNVAQKRKRSNIYLVFNNIKSHWSVFVILMLRLWSVVSCE